MHVSHSRLIGLWVSNSELILGHGLAHLIGTVPQLLTKKVSLPTAWPGRLSLIFAAALVFRMFSYYSTWNHSSSDWQNNQIESGFHT
jgi:hypothetical protein